MALSLLVSVLPAVARAEDESEDDFEQQLAALNEEKETAKNQCQKQGGKA